MTKYQVTALFGNIWEVCGADEVDYMEALRVYGIQCNAGRSARIHKITSNSGSIVIFEHNA